MEQASASGRINKQAHIHHQPLTRSPTSKFEASSSASAAKTTLLSHKLYHKPAQEEEAHISKPFNNKSQVWDCGSSLYDSFELNSFNLHLHQAIKASSVTRTLSMPHLPQGGHPEPLPVLAKHQLLPAPKKLGKQVSKSLKRILTSVVGSSKTVRNSSKVSSPFPKAKAREMQRDNFYVYNGSKSVRVLSTILETQESTDNEQSNYFVEDETPEVRRAASERFTAPVHGVSFA